MSLFPITFLLSYNGFVLLVIRVDTRFLSHYACENMYAYIHKLSSSELHGRKCRYFYAMAFDILIVFMFKRVLLFKGKSCLISKKLTTKL